MTVPCGSYSVLIGLIPASYRLSRGKVPVIQGKDLGKAGGFVAI